LRRRTRDLKCLPGCAVGFARDAMTPASVEDAEVVARGLRLYVGHRALETAQSMRELTEDEVMRIAYDELHTMRLERRGAA
jgi:hypothetical protein